MSLSEFLDLDILVITFKKFLSFLLLIFPLDPMCVYYYVCKTSCRNLFLFFDFVCNYIFVSFCLKNAVHVIFVLGTSCFLQDCLVNIFEKQVLPLCVQSLACD